MRHWNWNGFFDLCETGLGVSAAPPEAEACLGVGAPHSGRVANDLLEAFLEVVCQVAFQGGIPGSGGIIPGGGGMVIIGGGAPGIPGGGMPGTGKNGGAPGGPGKGNAALPPGPRSLAASAASSGVMAGSFTKPNSLRAKVTSLMISGKASSS